MTEKKNWTKTNRVPHLTGPNVGQMGSNSANVSWLLELPCHSYTTYLPIMQFIYNPTGSVLQGGEGESIKFIVTFKFVRILV